LLAGTLGGIAMFGFVAMIGLVAAMTTKIPHWNWYGFPTR
jgi:hypothetical protein